MASGEPSEYVTLISSDDYTFVVRRSAACISDAIKRMLDPRSMCTFLKELQGRFAKWVIDGFMESKTNTCRFDNIK